MTISFVLTPEGWDLLNSLPPYEESAVFQLSERLRRDGFAPDVVSAALTQSRLRARGAAKFGEFARTMVFTKDGLEQATRLEVGAFHARRLLDAGATKVIDLGCGIGADSMAFASLGLDVVAIERDEETAAAATVNLRHFPNAEVIMADGREADLASFGADAIWIDPARRINGARIKDPAKWMPSLAEALELAGRFDSAGIKVAPGIDYSDLPSNSRVEWISAGGDLLEAVIWLGRAAAEPGRRALLLGQVSGSVEWDAGVSDPRVPAVAVTPEELGPYIFEPDPAIIRSGSIASVCREFGMAPVSDSIAYFTGPEPVDSPLLSAFAVLGVLPIEAKAVRKALAKAGIGRVEIKKRGTDLSPDAFRLKLKLDDSLPGSATLIATPLLGRHRMVLAERLS